jgi:hypothetical protein
MVMGLKNSPLEIYIKEVFMKENLVGMENIIGKMEAFTKDLSRRV